MVDEFQCLIPRILLKKVLNHLYGLTDCGPCCEGWKSVELECDINSIIDILGLPEDDKW
jgi:hypothetical protein